MTTPTSTKRSDAQIHALILLAENGDTTTAEVADKAGVSKDIARETLRHLEERDLVERTSTVSNTWYGTKQSASLGAKLMRNCDGANDVPTPPWEQ